MKCRDETSPENNSDNILYCVDKSIATGNYNTQLSTQLNRTGYSPSGSYLHTLPISTSDLPFGTASAPNRYMMKNRIKMARPIINENGRGVSVPQLKFKMVVLLPMIVLWITLNHTFDLSFYNEELRRRLKACVLHTPFVRVQDVAGWMPPIVNPSSLGTPSHVSLCEAFLDRSEGSTVTKDLFSVTEDPSTCTDWTAPHYSVMEIYASSLIATVGRTLGLKYRHNCHRSIGNYKFKRGDVNGQVEEILTHWDFTTIQQLMVENLVTNADAKAVDSNTVKELCQGCIAFHKNGQKPDSFSSISHHCMLFPGNFKQESQLAFKSILPSVVDRLQKASKDWMRHSSPLIDEENTGVIIYIDDTSSLLHYTVYDANIPEKVSTIQIFVSASCARASVHHANNCVEHGRRIKRFFMQTRGLYEGTYVRIDVVAATAASFTRMVNVKTLVCPPGSVSCLLPAVAKNPGTKAVIIEASNHPVTFDWFHNLKQMEGIKDSVSVYSVNDDLLYMPVELIGEARGKDVAKDEEEEEQRMNGIAPQRVQHNGLLSLSNADALSLPIKSKNDSERESVVDQSLSHQGADEKPNEPTGEPASLSESETNPSATQEKHLSADQVLDLITETESTDNTGLEMVQRVDAPDPLDIDMGIEKGGTNQGEGLTKVEISSPFKIEKGDRRNLVSPEKRQIIMSRRAT